MWWAKPRDVEQLRQELYSENRMLRHDLKSHEERYWRLLEEVIALREFLNVVTIREPSRVVVRPKGAA
jgi:hypothetical protein